MEKVTLDQYTDILLSGPQQYIKVRQKRAEQNALKAKALMDEGLNYQEISQRLGIHYNTVRRILKKYCQVPNQRGGKKADPRLVQRICDEARKSEDISRDVPDIAQRLGLSRQLVRYHLRRQGLLEKGETRDLPPAIRPPDLRERLKVYRERARWKEPIFDNERAQMGMNTRGFFRDTREFPGLSADGQGT